MADFKRQNFSSHGKWEPVVGYSRAVRVGHLIFVAGTTAADPEGRVTGDACEQTVQTLRHVEAALKSAGASLTDVVRTRIFVQGIARDSDAVGRAYAEFFRDIFPVATMVEVRRFISDEMRVEIEVDAVKGLV